MVFRKQGGLDVSIEDLKAMSSVSKISGACARPLCCCDRHLHPESVKIYTTGA